jgi:serralysin
MRTYGFLGAAATLALATGGTMLLAPTALAAGTAATAATASAYVGDDGTVHYKAASGQTNKLTITETYSSAYVFTFADDVEITAGNGCSYPDPADPAGVQCTTSGNGDSDYYKHLYVADLGDGDDAATADAGNGAYGSIYGGTGDDSLKGTTQDILYGQDGNDHLAAAAVEFGGAGADVLTGTSAYPNELHGGSGNDNVTAYDSDDTLWGDSGSDVLHSGGGIDRLTGGNGDDRLYGGLHADILWGDAGNDSLHGGDAGDTLKGGTGGDRLFGETGKDDLYGNSGNDLLRGGTGTDNLSGGPGRDTVHQN